MKKIVLCNTMYQLLFAINIKLNSEQEDEVDIVLTDRTNFNDVYEQINKYKYFDKAFLINPDTLKKSGKMPRKLRRKMENVIYYNGILSSRYGLILDRYDEMYACNMDDIAVEMYAQLKMSNSQLKYIEFEDGYITYINQFRNKNHGKAAWLYKIFKVPYLCEKEVDLNLLYFPELYTNDDYIKREKMEVMDLRSSKVQEIIRNIFNYHETDINHKYILLEEAFNKDGLHNNIDCLFTGIIDIVGEQNVLLKTHPRNGDNYYYERKVAAFSYPVAWEALIASQNIDDKVLITCASGAAINTKLLCHSKCKIVFLKNLLTGEHDTRYIRNFELYFNQFIMKFSDECYVPNTLEELREILHEI